MTPEDYVNNAKRTESPNFYADKVSPRYLHAVMGMCTEAGEMQDGVKRALYYGKDLDTVNIQEEIGDMLWYIAIACDTFGFSMQEIMEKNIAKLKARFPDKFDDAAALNRDLDQERAALEGTSEQAA